MSLVVDSVISGNSSVYSKNWDKVLSKRCLKTVEEDRAETFPSAHLGELKIRKSNGKEKKFPLNPIIERLRKFDFNSIPGRPFADQKQFFHAITRIDMGPKGLRVEVNETFSIAIKKSENS